MEGELVKTLLDEFFGPVQLIDTDTDISEIQKEMMDGKDMRIVSASEWLKYPWNMVRMLLHHSGTYVVPTEELIDFLDKEIGDNSAIEICCGNGFIGRELNIPITDSCQQRDDKETALYYKLHGQPTIKYPKDVIKMEALEAVKHFRPHTVLGCYATHKYSYVTNDGNDHGVEFVKLLKRVKKLILVGNLVIHKNNPIMKLPHKEIWLEGLITRAEDPMTNRIFIWEN